jgi:CheY-like chemotaxis protein
MSLRERNLSSVHSIGGESRRPTVLIVEDDFDAREVLQMVLEGEGYSVVTATNGVEGIGRLHMDPTPALVVCDLMMAVMNGWDFCAAKAADPSVADIPVIVVSAVARMPGLRPIPGDVVLTKPFNVEQLLASVQRLLARPAAANTVTGSGR